ncbi:MAG: hypothetical protein QXQ30_01475 [Candidatus Pacearchaeota archaeon]
MKKNKAQFFIIAAIFGVIVIFSFFGLVVYKKISQPEKIYDLGKNFKFEVIETIAKGKIKVFGGNEDILINYLDNITHEYLKYSLTEDPNVEIIYIYGNKSNIVVYNFGNEELYVLNDSQEVRVEGGRKNISNTLSLVEIKITVIQEAESYYGSLDNIRKFFHNMDKIIINISNKIYTFEIGNEDNFYIILKTKRQNETFMAIEK